MTSKYQLKSQNISHFSWALRLLVLGLASNSESSVGDVVPGLKAMSLISRRQGGFGGVSSGGAEFQALHQQEYCVYQEAEWEEPFIWH